MRIDFKLISNTMLKWIGIWCVLVAILLWRIIDFIDEALHEGFHVTRAGLTMFHDQAAAFQLFIIISCLSFVWIVTHKIIHLIKTVLPSS